MAAGDATAIPVKNQAYRVTFPILDADGDLVTGATGLDSEVSKDGGTFADATSEATEIATASGMYYLDLTATEMNADTVAIIVKTTSSGAKTTPIVLYPRDTGDIKVTVESGGIVAGSFATGAIDAAAIATDAIGSNEIAAGAVTKIQAGLSTLTAAQANAEADAALADAGVTTTRTGYLDKLNITGNVASSAEATAIQNNTRVRVIVPPMIERPDTGSTAYKLHLYIYDDAGNMEAPDSAPTLAVANEAGTDRSANLGTVTAAGTGHYTVTYTVASGHAIEELLFEWSIVEGGVTRLHGAATQIVDTTAVDFTSADRAKLDTLHDTRLTSGRAMNLDNLDATVSTRATPAQVNTECDAAIADARLNQLLATTMATPAAGSLFAELTEDNGGVQRFTANALEQAPGGAGGNPNLLLNTTITTAPSQVSFTLTAGPTDDDGLKNQAVVFYDVSSGNAPSVRLCTDYVASTKTITIDSAPDFTVIAGDGIKFFVTAPGTTAPTVGQVSQEVWDEFANMKVLIDLPSGDIKRYRLDDTTLRGTVRPTQVNTVTQGWIPQ
jgi:hypothetical protein